jgi:S1-C subfamily serine protease
MGGASLRVYRRDARGRAGPGCQGRPNSDPCACGKGNHPLVKEDNPLYRDPVFREFFDLPKQLEKEVQATGSGVIVDAERGYVLTANHVVAQISKAQVTTKDGRKFDANWLGVTLQPTLPFFSFKDQEETSRPSHWVTATGSRSAIS